MYCVNEGRNLRNDSFSACWRKVCLYKGTEAQSCGYYGNVSLCKKHHSEKTRANKQSCSFPFKSSTECPGTIDRCPQRLLSVFDRFPTTAKPGTYICLKHLTSGPGGPRPGNLCSGGISSTTKGTVKVLLFLFFFSRSLFSFEWLRV